MSIRRKGFKPDKNSNTAGTKFFAAYVGPSMNPTLREPEMMEVVPYYNQPLRVGDVVFFLPPQKDHPVVHRIAHLTPEGMSTLGDNNSQEDSFLLQPEDIKGQVVGAWRGQKRRTIAGGLQGRLTSRWLRLRRIPANHVSYLLHPVYYALSRRGFVARLLPATFRPRVVIFQNQGQDQFRLLFGHQIIGRYDNHEHQWKIQRPFRLLVDERVLQIKLEENRTSLSHLNKDSTL